jgi:peptide/nickel transport system substrate-binding protein
VAGLAALLAACGPTAESTATSAPPTATTGGANPTATTASTQPTATTAAGATATTAEVKLRPVPVVAAPPPNPLAQKGGVYRRLGTEDPPDFGIWDSSVGSTFTPAVPAIDALLDTNVYEPNKLQQILPSLAYDWWTDQSGQTWTFKLKDGVKASDGRAFTCADAKFSVDTVRLGRDATGDELRRSPRGSLLVRVKDTKCVDDLTFEVTTNGPLPSLPQTLAFTSFAILPKHVYEGNLDLWLTTIGPGYGPFMFKEYKQTESVTLVRNPNYWQQPYPYLDEYQVINSGSTQASQAAFRVGRSEEGTLPVNIRDQMEKEGKIIVYGKHVADFVHFYQANWQRDPWKDPRFSLAMRCAIDSRKIINTALSGEGYEGPIFPLTETPGGPEWTITKNEWKAISPCHGPSTETNMPQRQQMARDLLAQMGFNAGNPAKPSAYAQANDQIMVSVLDDLNKVGIFPELRTVTTDARYNIQVNGESDIFQQSAQDSFRDPDHWLYAKFYSGSDRNYGKYTNAEIDALIDKQSRTLDKAERYKTIKEIETKLLKDNAMISAYFRYYIKLLSPWVKDLYWGQPDNGQNSAGKYSRAWIDQAKMKEILGQ